MMSMTIRMPMMAAVMLVDSASMPSVAEMVSSLFLAQIQGQRAGFCSLRQISCVCSSVKLPGDHHVAAIDGLVDSGAS